MAIDNSDIGEKVKNPDGTYNGIKLLSLLSGLSEDEVRSEWEKVKARKKEMNVKH